MADVPAVHNGINRRTFIAGATVVGAVAMTGCATQPSGENHLAMESSNSSPVGVPLLMGKDYLVEDPCMDDLILRLSTEPRTVADIVRIMNDAFGGQLQSGGSIGSPISESAQQPQEEA